MKWVVFQSYESGEQIFGYYVDEDEAQERYDELITHFSNTKVSVEIGMAEINKSKSLNWNS